MRLIGKLLALPFVVVTGIIWCVNSWWSFPAPCWGFYQESYFWRHWCCFCCRILAGAFMAGDCISDQPLWSADGGGLAGGDHRRRKQRVKGFCI